MSPELLVSLIGLAVLDSLSPTTIVVTIVVLLSAGRRSWPLLLIYWATIAAAYFTLGAVLMLGLGFVVATIDESVGLWLQAIVGLGLLLGSFFIKPGKPRDQSPRVRLLTPTSMLVLGLGTWGVEVVTAVPYFGAIALMTSAQTLTTQWTIALIGYVSVMMLPGVILAVAWTLAGERLRPRLERWRDKLRSGSTTAISWIIGIAGFLILRDAAWRLAVTYNLFEGAATLMPSLGLR